MVKDDDDLLCRSLPGNNPKRKWQGRDIVLFLGTCYQFDFIVIFPFSFNGVIPIFTP